MRSIIRHKLFRGAGVFLLWLIATAACYRHVNITFLRAESGWLQIMAHETPQGLATFRTNIWHYSYAGHYVPIALFLEMKQTQFAGQTEVYWRARAITLVAIIASLAFAVFRLVLLTARVTRTAASFVATGLTAVLIFQPLMLELIAWPFMILQLVWMALTLLAIFACFAAIHEPTARKWILLAVVSAYVSMHFSGLGFATTIAVGLVFLCLRLTSADSKTKRAITIALAILLLVTLMQGIAMFGVGNVQAASPLPLRQLIAELAALFLQIPIAAAAALIQPLYLPANAAPILLPLAAFGLLLAVGMLALAASELRSLWQQTKKFSVRSAAFLFGSVLLATVIALIAVRELHYPSGNSLLQYVSGSRYLVPLSVILVGFTAAIVPFGMQRATRLVALIALLLAPASFISQRVFQKQVYPQLNPAAQISHRQFFSLTAQMVEQSRRAHLPIPNLQLNRVTELAFFLDKFDRVLHDRLNLPPDDQFEFAPLTDCLREHRQDYVEHVPALIPLLQMLGQDEGRQH